MAKQLTLGIPYRQFSILSRWIKTAGKSPADLAAVAPAEVDRIHALNALDLHREGAELCQWVLIQYPSIADDMDDGDEEADWMDVAAIDGASIKYNGPGAWTDRPLPEIHEAALLVQSELKRRYYPDGKKHDRFGRVVVVTEP
ncbi:hypothetical protein RQP46_001731 [Phenoliferia psychrophenolica]